MPKIMGALVLVTWFLAHCGLAKEEKETQGFWGLVQKGAQQYAASQYEKFMQDPESYVKAASEILNHVSSDDAKEREKGYSKAAGAVKHAGVSVLKKVAKSKLTDEMAKMEYTAHWEGLIIQKEQLNPGDMIFVARLGGLYRHYGVYLGVEPGSEEELVFDFSVNTKSDEPLFPHARKRTLESFVNDSPDIYREMKGTEWIDNLPIPPELPPENSVEFRREAKRRLNSVLKRIFELEKRGPHFPGVPLEYLHIKGPVEQRYDLIYNNCEHLSRWLIWDLRQNEEGVHVPKSYQAEFLEELMLSLGVDVEEGKRLLMSVGTH